MSDDPMRILVVEPTKDPYVKEIDGSLASMQAIVGGFIQAVEPFDDHNVLLVCNEEAKLLGLPENRFLRNRNGIPYDIIHGTFFLGISFFDRQADPDLYAPVFPRKAVRHAAWKGDQSAKERKIDA